MKTNLTYDMYVPTRVMFGAGMLDKLSEQQMPGKRALIVISNGKSTRANGYLSRTEEQLHKAGVETVVFDGVMPNPTVGNVNAGAKAARENGCDFLVALGGGSVMDCTKAIAVMATNDGELWDYVPIGSGKGQPIAVKPLPIIAITTTAGTGSETDNSGVITKEDTFEKAFVGDASLFPVLSIVDPELMASVPPTFTAYHPALPHGAGLIMVSRAYYKYFIEHHACDDRFIRMAQAMGMPEATKPEDFLTALTRLQEACGVADLKMSDYGITPDEFETLMRNTREVMGVMFTSDRVQMTDEDIVNVYKESYK